MVGPFEFGVFKDARGWFFRDNDGTVIRCHSYSDAFQRVTEWKRK